MPSLRKQKMVAKLKTANENRKRAFSPSPSPNLYKKTIRVVQSKNSKKVG